VSNWEACEGSFYPIYFIMIVTIYFEIYVEAMKLVSSNIFIMTVLWCLIFFVLSINFFSNEYMAISNPLEEM
jgi:hypothetical protein